MGFKYPKSVANIPAPFGYDYSLTAAKLASTSSTESSTPSQATLSTSALVTKHLKDYHFQLVDDTSQNTSTNHELLDILRENGRLYLSPIFTIKNTSSSDHAALFSYLNEREYVECLGGGFVYRQRKAQNRGKIYLGVDRPSHERGWTKRSDVIVIAI